MWRIVRNRTRYRGFTLIELMVVLVILGVLVVLLLPRLSEAGDVAREKMARGFLAQVDATIAEYEDHFGDYPPSHFPDAWGTPPNTTNIGAEALVLALWSPDWGGASLGEDKLVNTDADESKNPLARFQKPALFELKDEWGNPIAYIHRRDHGKQSTYITESPETGETIESTVRAQKNSETQSYWNANRYQLISAGPDGEFGTADDLGNWSPPRK